MGRVDNNTNTEQNANKLDRANNNIDVNLNAGGLAAANKNAYMKQNLNKANNTLDADEANNWEKKVKMCKFNSFWLLLISNENWK